MRPNPFVGPRPFRVGEQLYGRDRELRRLVDLLIAERLVLLHAPSGAGKSSLVHAALTPRMRDEGFAVLPPIRVGLEPPATLLPGQPADEDWLLRQLLGPESGSLGQATHQQATPNRYVLSALLSLEEGLAPGAQLPLAQLAGMSLDDYLAHRESLLGPHDGVLLIFDQFEEILTADPTDVAAKEQFFAQVGAALFARQRWALFAMRDDYVGPLEPYLRPIPTRLSNSFHLDLLGLEPALEAMRRPVADAGATFTEAAARRLADDLRRVRVLHADGTVSEQVGPAIEPVQLQVVCFRLWARLPDDDRSIDPEDVAALGDVDQALTGYYADRVASIAAAIGVAERALRDWCEHDLITEQGIRGQVLAGAARLDRRAVAGLVDAHLVRGERRRGATWLELAHDRLVAPVRADNAAWREANLSPLQRQAAIWEQQQRPEGLLLRGDALVAAEAWVAANETLLTASERDFLLACREAEAAAEHERRVTRRIRRLGIASAVAGTLALIAAVGAFFLWRAAEHQTAIAELRRLQTELGALPAGDPQLALLLNLEAMAMSADAGLTDDASAEAALRRSLMGLTGTALTGHTGSVRLVASSPDAARVASAGFDGTVRVWAIDTPAQPPVVLAGHTDSIAALVYSPDGRALASAGDDGTIRIWRTEQLEALPTVLTAQGAPVVALAFSPDGALLASGGGDGGVLVWRAGDWGAAPIALVDKGEAGGPVLAFSPDGLWLAVGAGDIRLWRAGRWDTPPVALEGAEDPRRLAFSPDGRSLAAVDGGGAVTIWRTGDQRRLAQDTPESPRTIWDLKYSPDGAVLAATTSDGSVILWANGDLEAEPHVLPIHTGAVRALAFSSDGAYLASGGEDRKIILTALGETPGPVAQLTGHSNEVLALAFSSDGSRLISGSRDRTLHLWSVEASVVRPIDLFRQGAQLLTLTFSPGGSYLAAGYTDGAVLVWSVGPSRIPRPVATLVDQTSYIATMAFSPDERYLAYGGQDQSVRVWSIGSWDQPEAVLPGHGDTVNTLAFSPDSALLATGGNDGALKLWATGDWERAPLALEIEAAGTSLLAFSPDGRRLAGAAAGGAVVLWEVGGAAPFPWHVLADAGSDTYALAFSPDSRYLAAGEAAGGVRLWELTSPQLAQSVYPLHTGPVTDLVFSPDSRTLFSASDDGTVRRWTLGSEAEDSLALLTQTAGVRAIVLSPDGGSLASAGADGRLLLWQMQSEPPPPLELGQGNSGASQIAMSPDGGMLVTGGLEGPLQGWLVRRADVLAVSCEVAGRSLSWEDWKAYIGQRRPYRATCAGRPAVPSLIESAAVIARAGDLDGALALVARARTLDMEREASPLGWSELCLWGSLAGSPARVMFACDRAVALLADNPEVRESRGIARALAGDLPRAREDFEVVARRTGTVRGDRSAQWADELRAGRNPFDEATLDELRAQAP